MRSWAVGDGHEPRISPPLCPECLGPALQLHRLQSHGNQGHPRPTADVAALRPERRAFAGPGRFRRRSGKFHSAAGVDTAPLSCGRFGGAPGYEITPNRLRVVS
jgi:hypothetical protein